MIKRDPNLPVKRQAELLDISRSSVYYRGRPVRPDTLALMRRIDELHLELPFAGARMLRLEGTRAGRHRIRRLMRIMGIEALYRRRNTSAQHAEHPVGLGTVKLRYSFWWRIQNKMIKCVQLLLST